MNRIEEVRKNVDRMLCDMADKEERKCAYIHLYGVAQAAALIAGKRRENVELSIVAAMLHDIDSYKNGYSADHGPKGAEMAKEILENLQIFSCEETELIYSAIYHHSDKEAIDGSFDEVLKDADVMQHTFYNPLFEVKAHESERLNRIKEEFGMI